MNLNGWYNMTWTPGNVFTDLVQYFNTSIYTGGMKFNVLSENVYANKCTVPAHVTMDLYPWGGSYSSSLSGQSLASDFYLVSPEKIDKWHSIVFVWDDLSPGEYIWHFHIVSAPLDGCLYFEYDTDSTKAQSWVDGDTFLDVDSWLFELNSTETYEEVISVGDQFKLQWSYHNTYYYDVIDGKDNVKVNISPGGTAVYKSVGTTTKLVSSTEKGRIVGGCGNVKI